MQVTANVIFVIGAIITAAIAVIGAGGAAVVWFVRLEAKQVADKNEWRASLTAHEVLCAERQLHISQALERIEKTQEAEHTENRTTLERMEGQIGALAVKS